MRNGFAPRFNMEFHDATLEIRDDKSPGVAQNAIFPVASSGKNHEGDQFIIGVKKNSDDRAGVDPANAHRMKTGEQTPGILAFRLPRLKGKDQRENKKNESDPSYIRA
jgi:hypothetical protein